MKKEEGEEERTVKKETKGRDERREGGECADICRGEEEGEGRGAEG